MLCNFPTEIIEEFLQYLPLSDLIHTLKLNRRLWRIATWSKSRVKQRLKRHIDVRLVLNSQSSSDICRCLGTLNTIELYITMVNTDAEDHEWMKRSEQYDYVIPIWSKCCDRQFNTDLEQNKRLHKYDLMEPEPIIQTILELYRGFQTVIRVEHRTIEEAITKCIFFIRSLGQFTFIRHFGFDISASTKIWNLFANYLNAEPLAFPGYHPDICMSNVQQNIDSILSSRQFQKGIRSIENNDNFIMEVNNSNSLLLSYRDKLKNAKRVVLNSNSLPIKDSDLIDLFDKTDYLILNNAIFVTADGIANVVKHFYENQQSRNRTIKIRSMSFHSVREFMRLIPRNAYIHMPNLNYDDEDGRKDPPYAIFTNKFGEKWLVKDSYHDEYTFTIESYCF